jgi:glucose/arabinose dehydrogenase
MEMAFCDGEQFPAEYRGDILVAFHGSWNRSRRTGYKIARVWLNDGQPTGEYEDFLTGFVIDDNNVWARPVGVAVAQDGSLLVSKDGNGSIWRSHIAVCSKGRIGDVARALVEIGHDDNTF